MSRTNHHSDKRKQALFGRDWHWLQREPWWHRHVHKHIPKRRETRHLEYLVISNAADIENLSWPLDKKPWFYYW